MSLSAIFILRAIRFMIGFRHFSPKRKTAILLVWLSIEKLGFFHYRSFHKVFISFLMISKMLESLQNLVTESVSFEPILISIILIN